MEIILAKGGARPGAGRPKGLQNRKTVEQARQVAETGETPLAYLLRVMRDEAADEATRRDCAKAAAQYVHPKLSAIDQSIEAVVSVGDVLDDLPDE